MEVKLLEIIQFQTVMTKIRQSILVQMSSKMFMSLLVNLLLCPSVSCNHQSRNITYTSEKGEASKKWQRAKPFYGKSSKGVDMNHLFFFNKCKNISFIFFFRTQIFKSFEVELAKQVKKQN